MKYLWSVHSLPEIQGDSACPVESAFVYINKGDELGTADSVRVVVIKDSSDRELWSNGVAEVKLLARICQDDEWSCSASSRVMAFERSSPSVAAAMPRVSMLTGQSQRGLG